MELYEIKAMLVNLDERIRSLETTLRGPPSEFFLDNIEKSLIKMMRQHDWGHRDDPTDFKRIALGESTYAQMIRIASELPPSRLLPIWENPANRQPLKGDPRFSGTSDLKLARHLDPHWGKKQ